MPKLERKAAPTKQKKEKVKEVVEGAAAAVTGAVEKVKEAVVGATPKKSEVAPKEKKEKPPKVKAGGKAPAPAEEIGEPMPSMIDLRVGQIKESEQA